MDRVLFFSSAPENLYMYEGEDYSKPTEGDRRTFDQMLAGRGLG